MSDLHTQRYNIHFHHYKLDTTVTTSGDVVDEWISNIRNVQPHLARGRNTIVGLDTECFNTGDNDVAIMQICIGDCVLIFQLSHADYIPDSLSRFLEHDDNTFCGIYIDDVAEDLFPTTGLYVGKTMDIGEAASTKYNDESFMSMGLQSMLKYFLSLDMETPEDPNFHNAWGNRQLTLAQVEYACINVFVLFKLAYILSYW